MLLTYEAEIDEQGVIRLSDLLRFPRRRVLVTVLDEYVDEAPQAGKDRLFELMNKAWENNDSSLDEDEVMQLVIEAQQAVRAEMRDEARP